MSAPTRTKSTVTAGELRREFLGRLSDAGESERNVAAHLLGIDRFAEYLAPRAFHEARDRDLEGFLSYLTELEVSAASLKTYRTVVTRWLAFLAERRAAEGESEPAPGEDGEFPTLNLRDYQPPVAVMPAAGAPRRAPAQPVRTKPMMPAVEEWPSEAGVTSEATGGRSETPGASPIAAPRPVREPEPTVMFESVAPAESESAPEDPVAESEPFPAATAGATMVFEPASAEPPIEAEACGPKPGVESAAEAAPAAPAGATMVFEPATSDPPLAAESFTSTPGFEPVDEPGPAGSAGATMVFEPATSDAPLAAESFTSTPGFEPVDEPASVDEAPAEEPQPAARSAQTPPASPSDPADNEAAPSFEPVPAPSSPVEHGDETSRAAHEGAEAAFELPPALPPSTETAGEAPSFDRLGDATATSTPPAPPTGAAEGPPAMSAEGPVETMQAPELPMQDGPAVPELPGDEAYAGPADNIPFAGSGTEAELDPERTQTRPPKLSGASGRDPSDGGMETMPGLGKWAVRRAQGERANLTIEALIAMAVAGELTSHDMARKPSGEWVVVTELRPLRRALGLDREVVAPPPPVRRERNLLRASIAVAVTTAACTGLWWIASLAMGAELVPMTILGGLAGGLATRLACHRPTITAGLLASGVAPAMLGFGRYLVYQTLMSGVDVGGFEEVGALGAFLVSGLGTVPLTCLGLGALAGFLLGALGSRGEA